MLPPGARAGAPEILTQVALPQGSEPEFYVAARRLMLFSRCWRESPVFRVDVAAIAESEGPRVAQGPFMLLRDMVSRWGLAVDGDLCNNWASHGRTLALPVLTKFTSDTGWTWPVPWLLSPSQA